MLVSSELRTVQMRAVIFFKSKTNGGRDGPIPA